MTFGCLRPWWQAAASPPPPRALAIPKSRISRRVAALESELGVRLIERSTRRFKVTDIGQDIYRHARAALAEADAIQDTAARLKVEPQGLVRISCPPGPTGFWRSGCRLSWRSIPSCACR